jgi:hypothetical protein
LLGFERFHKDVFEADERMCAEIGAEVKIEGNTTTNVDDVLLTMKMGMK